MSRASAISVALAAIALAVAAWLVWRAAIHALRRYVRNLWPH